jgi:hypothetical protein
MSSRHAEHHGEYLRLACIAIQRLLASPFASQFQAATAVGNVYSLASIRGTVVRVTGRRCFCAHSVDICVEVRRVVVPQARTPYRESAYNSRSCFTYAGSGRVARRAAEVV